MRRRDLLGAIGALITGQSTAAFSQRGARPAKIGFLHPGSEPVVRLRVKQMSEGLHGSGYVEGRDFGWLIRWGDFHSERLGVLAKELVDQQVDVMVAPARATEEAVLSATKTIPIVALDLETDPVEAGFVVSLARPGKTLTGIFFDFPEISAKWLQLLTEVFPRLMRLAVL